MSTVRHRVNGQAGAAVDVSDRGLQYGDGCFETLAVRDGRPLLWRAHMDRLRRGLRRLAIPDGFSEDELLRESEALVQDEDRAVLKIIVTRGTSGRGYRPDRSGPVTRVISAHPWPDFPRRIFDPGMSLRVCQTRVSRNRRLGGIKHLNRLPQVLARGEWEDDYDEGLMLDDSGHVIEGTMSNVFAVFDGVLHTPRVDEAGVEGVMRNHVIAAARGLGYTCMEDEIDLALLMRADGIFMTNSLLGIVPVARVEGRALQPAACVRPLQECISDVVAS